MPALTIPDLINAKQDVDHIAELATSNGQTATDRLGNTKLTMAEALRRIKSYTDRGAWTPSTSYATYDSVTVSGDRYLTITAHVSGSTFSGDLASKWVLIGGAVRTALGSLTLVKDAGAAGDGAADDTAELLSAKASGESPYVPSGTYSVTDIAGLHGLWGDGKILFDGNTLPLPKAPRESDNFKTDRFFSYAKVTDRFQPILVIGDSISEGSNAAVWTKDNYASIIRKAIQRKYQNANFGFANFNLAAQDGSPSATKYPHVVTHSGFALTAYGGFTDSYYGGTVLKSATAGDWVEVSYTGKDVVVVYGQDAAGAILNVTLDGVLIGTIDTKAASATSIAGSGVNGSFSTVIAVPAWGSHTIRLTNTENKNVALCGMVYLEESAVKSPVLFNLGRSSLTLSDMDNNLLDMYARSTGMSILALGVNDNLLAKPIVTFKAKLKRYLSGVKAINGECVICDFIFNEPSSNAYKSALRDYAYIYGFPYLDFGRMWFSDQTANKFAKLLDTDNVHPTDAGHEFIANEIMRCIGLNYDKATATGHMPTVSLVPTGSWVGLSTPYAGPKARKDSTGRVHLSGAIQSGSSAAYTLIATIPAGFRPQNHLIFAVSANHAFGEIEIHADGQITAGGTTIAGLLSLDGISYLAA
ncbi:SGNH/GDSL hydrolase family protein [Noviherbaspirillum autotrophicum]|uniref:SGNH hydrolase-type esterase domain-containing protein n=1 Tax=Noviherbaspirillum autotrophicum TaxID=709839 RepID=A0A0C2BL94_9BURK|nr:SGNH/GDSL hydrolase family protein [Noviherbaspirillum autotrophicum]KIF80769.1 hypothetical protein TSA66_07960 [Noviherbaspirillum autotrophicum]KIF80806.1 hypothetical protein TSA66_08205 [Noviherbaspirillum autotrophicum]KIF84031.1 hypothetical protein TSA66_00895 [Noviherbaspirillum autotrophicum]